MVSLHEKLFILLAAACIAVTGCATNTKATGLVKLGMTEGQVFRACGEPYFKTSVAPGEQWHYRDAVWKDGRWTWDRIPHTTRIDFLRGRVSAIIGGEDSRQSSSVTITRLPPQAPPPQPANAAPERHAGCEPTGRSREVQPTRESRLSAPGSLW